MPVELLVDTTAYGVPGLTWCEFDHRSPGEMSVYPIKVKIPGKGIGQYRDDEVVDTRGRDEG